MLWLVSFVAILPLGVALALSCHRSSEIVFFWTLAGVGPEDIIAPQAQIIRQSSTLALIKFFVEGGNTSRCPDR